MLKTLTGCMGLFVLVSVLTGCYRPPYNNFKPDPPLYALLRDSRASLIKELFSNNIEVVQYGDQVTLIVPTDQYFDFGRDHLDELQYKGLRAIVNFIKLYPKCMIAVAGFSDNVDQARTNVLLTDARAHAMVAFLWANDISARRLIPQGFGEYFPVGDNRIVRGRAYNRRLEIQWPARGPKVFERVDAVNLIKKRPIGHM
jgi:outer membrane protein OmpA-like peptidoglycan-associated protein